MSEGNGCSALLWLRFVRLGFRRAAVVAVAALCMTPLPAAAATLPPLSGVPPISDYQLLQSLRSSSLQYTWHAPTTEVSSGGACGTNQGYDAGTTTIFYIEQQSCAEDVLLPAILDRDPAAINVALRALDWGFAREAANGSFPAQSDPFHSTCFFLVSAARTVLLLRESPFSAQYAAKLATYVDPLQRAAAYLTRSDVLAAGRAGDTPYGHRRFLLAAAVGMVGHVTNSATFNRLARGFISDGVALQRSDGVVPELGGPDTHYQAYGMLFAIDWLLYNQADTTAPQLVTAIDRALAWEASQVGSDGKVSIANNTRTNGQEVNRDGTPKKLVYSFVIRGLGEWSLMRNDPSLLAIAQRVAAYKQAHPGV
jgi:hypothetical protein